MDNREKRARITWAITKGLVVVGAGLMGYLLAPKDHRHTGVVIGMSFGSLVLGPALDIYTGNLWQGAQKHMH